MLLSCKTFEGSRWHKSYSKPPLVQHIHLKAFATCRKPRVALLENCQLCRWGLHIFATCVFWSLAQKIRGGIIFRLLRCSFLVCPKIHFATTGKKWQKKTKQYVWLEQYVWFKHLRTKILWYRAYVLRSCAAGASCYSSSLVWGFDVDHRTWSKDPIRSMHPIRSSGSHVTTGLLKKPTVSKELGTCKQPNSRDFKSTPCRIVPSCPCFSQSRVSTDSLEQCTHDLLVSYYENITEKQKNQTLTFQSLTLVVIGAPQSGTCFYLSQRTHLHFSPRSVYVPSIRWLHRSELFDVVWPVHNHSRHEYDCIISVTQHTSNTNLQQVVRTI